MVTSTLTLPNAILQKKHQIDWDSATCITFSTPYYQRLTLDSWFTNLEQTQLNRRQQLPVPYKRRNQTKLTTRERLKPTNWLTMTGNEASSYYLMSEIAHDHDRLTTFEDWQPYRQM